MENIQLRLAIITGPKSLVPFGIDGLLIPVIFLLVATAKLNEGHNGQNRHSEKYVLHDVRFVCRR